MRSTVLVLRAGRVCEHTTDSPSPRQAHSENDNVPPSFWGYADQCEDSDRSAEDVSRFPVGESQSKRVHSRPLPPALPTHKESENSGPLQFEVRAEGA